MEAGLLGPGEARRPSVSKQSLEMVAGLLGPGAYMVTELLGPREANRASGSK